MPYLIKGQSALEKLGPLKLGVFFFFFSMNVNGLAVVEKRRQVVRRVY